jgi:hypothetical protein
MPGGFFSLFAAKKAFCIDTLNPYHTRQKKKWIGLMAEKRYSLIKKESNIDNEKRRSPSFYTIIFFSLLFLFTLCRIWIGSRVPLGADEAYIWEWSRHPALCYYDHPPLTAWIVRFFTWISATKTTVRLVGPLSFAGFSFILWKFTKKLYSSSATAMLAGLLPSTIPLFAVGGIITSVEGPFILTWILTLFFFHSAIIKKKPIAWYLTGIAIGLGMMSKYLMILFLPAAFFFLLFSKQHRPLLRTKEPWLALLLAFILFIPAIIWNANHHWANFALNFTNRGSPNPISPQVSSFLLFFATQAAVITPLFFIGIIVLIATFLSTKKEKNEDSFFLLMMSLPIFIFFLFFSAIGKTAAHWPAIGYIALFPPLAHAIVSSSFTTQWKRTLFLAGTLFAFFITLILHTAILFPNTTARLLPSKQRARFLFFMGPWQKKLATHIASLQEELGGTNNTFLMCRGFSLASYIAFSHPLQPEVYAIFQQPGLGRGYSYWQDFTRVLGKDCIFIEEGGRESTTARLTKAFDTIEKMDDITFIEEGIPMMRIALWKCSHFKGLRDA